MRGVIRVRRPGRRLDVRLQYAFTAGRPAEPVFYHVWPRLVGRHAVSPAWGRGPRGAARREPGGMRASEPAAAAYRRVR